MFFYLFFLATGVPTQRPGEVVGMQPCTAYILSCNPERAYTTVQRDRRDFVPVILFCIAYFLISHSMRYQLPWPIAQVVLEL